MKTVTVITLIPLLVLCLSCANGNGGEKAEAPAQADAHQKTAPGDQVTWNIDNLASIGGHTLTVLGAPQIVDTPGGKALLFDGVDDGIIVDNHPLEGAGAFTLEVIFRPDPDGLPEQRFFHLQEDETNNRFLIETRLTEDNEWCLDTFILSGETDQTLLDRTKLHPAGEWYNATLVFDGTEMRHYVNGAQELSAVLPSFTPPKAGKTSIGVRINQVHWFKGVIRQARFTRRALPPEEFLKP